MLKRALILITVSLFFSANIAFAEVYRVKAGDTLHSILSDRFSPQDIIEIFHNMRSHYKSFSLKVGMNVMLNEDSVVFPLGMDKDFTIVADELSGKPKVIFNTYIPDIMLTTVQGTIETNLFDAMDRVGEGPDLAAMLADIFEWEIDFFKDLQKGDTFKLLVEKRFVNGRYVGYGRILAAEFKNRGVSKKAVYYDNGGLNRGYYNENGIALSRGFLRVPLNYSRISSRFTSSRLHPVLGYYRPHHGVDYAAPTGTPVKATANGTVSLAMRDKASGNFVAIRHANGYETFYLHLNGFAKGIRKGVSVRQGQVIGYVGSTGYSTGPHLDYRIKRNGSWINPMRFGGSPKRITASNKQLFYEETAEYFERLGTIIHGGMQNASNSPKMLELGFSSAIQ